MVDPAAPMQFFLDSMLTTLTTPKKEQHRSPWVDFMASSASLAEPKCLRATGLLNPLLRGGVFVTRLSLCS